MTGYMERRGVYQYWRYRCSSKTDTSPKSLCHGRVRADTIDGQVWDVLVDNLNLLRDQEYLRNYINQKRAYGNQVYEQTRG
jgi:hypothetical protein